MAQHVVTLFDDLEGFEGEWWEPTETYFNETGEYLVTRYDPFPKWSEWSADVNAHVLDMTGYDMTLFTEYPTYKTMFQWPRTPYDAAIEVLKRDVYGQEVLLGYHDDENEVE